MEGLIIKSKVTWLKWLLIIGIIFVVLFISGVACSRLGQSRGSSGISLIGGDVGSVSASKESYDKGYSEYSYLEDKVRVNEKYLAYWVATYVGKSGNSLANTSSLVVNGVESSGRYRSLGDFLGTYPSLNGVVSDVSISYYYDEDTSTLVQSVEVFRDSIGDSRTVYVVYDKEAVVVDYTVIGSVVGNG